MPIGVCTTIVGAGAYRAAKCGRMAGGSWLDSNTMMVRMKLPSVLLKDGTIAFDVKGEFEDGFETQNRKRNLSRRLSVTAIGTILTK